jgi:flagellar hook-associated protein 1 FlgK
MNKFWDSWENLANNPSDLAARTALRSNANMLTDVFHNIASELETLKATRNQEMVSVVDKINTIAMEIFGLNSEISLVQLQGQMQNDSMDRRDQLMSELSELVDFESQSSPNGETTISVGGNLLVSPISVNRIEIFEDATTRTSPDANYHQFGIRMEKGKNQIIPRGGQLAGLIISRDETIPAMQAQLDELAKGLVTAVNAQHKLGFNLDGFVGFDFFDPTGLTAKDIKLSAAVRTNVHNIAAAGGAAAPMRVSMERAFQREMFPSPLQLTKDGLKTNVFRKESMNGVSDANMFAGTGFQLTRNGNPAVNIGPDNMSITVRDTVSGGAPITLDEGTHFNINRSTGIITMISPAADGFNAANFEFDIDFEYWSVGGDPANNIVAGSVTVKALSTGTVGETILQENVHYKVNYALGQIEMLEFLPDRTTPNPFLNATPSFEFVIDFSYSQGAGFTGIGNNENAIAISELRKALTMSEGIMGGKTSTFDQFYGSAIADLGLQRKESMANIDTREYLIGQYDAHQDSIAGVNPDEEIANLIKYQYTYQAAARIFSTAQSMLDILMNL